MNKKAPVKTLEKACDVSFKHHAVIEASAGTGKTYTLIELVMRLLKEQRIPLEQILLMTFTEQATRELKARIRSRIQEELSRCQYDKALSNHLAECLLNINQAAVFTIHGFCQGALKEFAFEQGAAFDSELVNDHELLKRLLQQLKRQWPANPILLEKLKHFMAEEKIQRLDSLLLDLAKQFNPEFDVLYPQADQLDKQQLFDLLEKCDLSGIIKLDEEFSSLQGLYSTAYKNLWQGVIKPFLQQLSHLKTFGNFSQINHLFQKTFAKKSDVFQVFFSRQKKIVYLEGIANSKATENRQLAPQLFKLVDRLNDLWAFLRLYSLGKKYLAVPGLLAQLSEQCQQVKINHSLISYDDMISRLWLHLKAEKKQQPRQQLLTQSLRNKYRVAMVDEFQDTDRKQWEIFKQLFLDSPESQHQLLVIGDPKQAIYGFRGADIHIYRQATASIVQDYQGKAYRLKVNYRTADSLVQMLNKFFVGDEKSSGWFVADAVTVDSAEQHINPDDCPKITANPHQLSPINRLLTTLASSDEMRFDLARQMALTIKHQLVNQLKFRLKGEERTLQPSDICILVRSNEEANTVEEALRQEAVPFTIHKKRNLYQSEEALHFQVLLTALARPHERGRVNNALLTLFFGLKPAQLKDFADEKLPEINTLWLKVKEAVADKNWILVFALLLHDSGALFRLRKSSRRLANVKQLKQQLLETALRGNLEANTLLKEFQQWRNHNSSDQDIHDKDTEQQAVRIMTMHISKGLEFPVVFLFGGFSYKDSNKFYKFYDEERQCHVFDLTKTYKNAFQAQEIEEALQLYYVAMTRAIFMLFLPEIDQSLKAVPRPGLYVQTKIKRMQQMDLPQISLTIESAHAVISKAKKSKGLPEPLIAPIDLSPRRRMLHSFSSLSQYKNNPQQDNVGDDITRKLTSELIEADVQANQMNSNLMNMTIPGGVKTGLVLHGIFEHIDFARVLTLDRVEQVYSDKALMRVVEQQMQQFKLDNKDLLDETGQVYLDYRRQLAQWVWHTLKKPLDALNGHCLAEIEYNQRCHELSFFWNQGQVNLTGFIDLLFALPDVTGRINYYILDWKSNQSLNGYTPEVLAEEVMKKHQYNWQYQLYALAMKRWFDGLNLKNAHLKGAIYLFSRGVNCLEQDQNGVFFDDFDRSSWNLQEIERDLLLMNQTLDGTGS